MSSGENARQTRPPRPEDGHVSYISDTYFVNRCFLQNPTLRPTPFITELVSPEAWRRAAVDPLL